MEPGVAAVMRSKHILLLEKIATSFGWPDMEVFKCLKNGFPLVGESQPSGIFDVDRKPASLTREELLQHSRFLRPALWAKVSSTPLDDTAKCIWEATQQELIERNGLPALFRGNNCKLATQRVGFRLGGLGWFRRTRQDQ